MENNTNTIDIKALTLKLLRKWYWFALGLFITGCLLTLYYFSTTSKFAVNSRIMIREDESQGMNNFAALSALGLGGSGKIVDDEMAILTSRDIISDVIQSLNIQTEYRKRKGLRWLGQYPTPDLRVEYPEQFLDTMRFKTTLKFRVRGSGYVLKVKYGREASSKHKITDLSQPIETCIGPIRIIPIRPFEPGDKYKMITAPMLPLAAAYNENIQTAKLKRESNVINIATQTDMPLRAIDFIKKEIELYNKSAVDDKNMMASNTAMFISERMNIIEAELSKAEQDVQNYKQSNHLTDLSSEARLYLMTSSEYEKRLAEVDMQYNLLDYVEQFVQDSKNNGKLIPANLGIADESVTSLISGYNSSLIRRMRLERSATDTNPVLKQLAIESELMRGNIVATIESVKQSLRVTRRDLQAQQDRAGGQVSTVPRKEREYIEVERQRNLKEQLYLLLYQKREENALLLASTVMPAKVVDVAKQDPERVSPKISILGLIWLVLGIGIPFGIIYLYDIFNDRIEDEAEYKRLIHLPYAGELVRNHHGRFVAVQDGVNSVSAELFRSLRTNLRFMQPADVKNPVVLVTSAVNGEGKSYVATNLAISLALLNKKVALVGLDIRKPMLAHYLELPTQGNLTSYLADPSFTIDDLIVSSGLHAGLDVLPAGVIPPNPSELILSERLDELFKELRKRYDYIIVDTAPVELVSDTFILTRVADMTLFVSRIHRTTRDMLASLQQHAADGRLKNVACVLNGVKSARAGYGYGNTKS